MILICKGSVAGSVFCWKPGKPVAFRLKTLTIIYPPTGFKNMHSYLLLYTIILLYYKDQLYSSLHVILVPTSIEARNQNVKLCAQISPFKNAFFHLHLPLQVTFTDDNKRTRHRRANKNRKTSYLPPPYFRTLGFWTRDLRLRF